MCFKNLSITICYTLRWFIYVFTIFKDKYFFVY